MQRAASLLFASRLTADVLAALVVVSYHPAGKPQGGTSVAIVLLAAHILFAGLAWRRQTRGTLTPAFVSGDVLGSVAVLILASYWAEGLYSPILYLLLVEVAGFAVVFGPAPGGLAALAGAGGVVALAVADALGLRPLLGAGVSVAAVPRFVDLGTKIAAGGLLLVGITRATAWGRARETELRRETQRAREAAEFQGALAEIALVTLEREGLGPTLAYVCERARALLQCETVLVCLLDGQALVRHAVSPAAEAAPWVSGPLKEDPSASARAARERRVVVDEGPIGDHPEVPTTAGAERACRVVALPLVGRNARVVGTLTCVDAGTPRDVRAWQLRADLLAAQATAAVERAVLTERLAAEAERVGALLRVSQEIGHGASSYPDLVKRIARLTRDLLAADQVTLLCADGAPGAFGARALEGLDDEDAEEWSRLRCAIRQAPEDVPSPYREAKREGRLILAPLRHAGITYGLLAARRTSTPGSFDGRQIALLEGIARQAAMALDNLRLLEDEREASSLSTTLLEVTQEFNLALDPSTLLARLASRALELTAAVAAVITLWRPREERYRIEHVHGPDGDGAGSLVGSDLERTSYERRGDGLGVAPGVLDRLATSLGLAQGAVAEITVPMERGGVVVGALTLLGATSTPRRVALARGLASQAAIAFQNVRLLEESREASRLKSEFVATMSHEIRTPLNVVLGYLELLLDDAFGPLAEEQKGVLERMQRSARELFELVTSTLDLNRLESGKSRVLVESVAVPELFAQLEAETRVGLELGDIELEWRLAPNLPALRTDRAKLRMVLKNLVSNAVKFTDHGRVLVSVAQEGGAVVFTVSDTGSGIRGEDVPVIFDMFRQLEPSSTRRHGGVGLGLYIVKRLVDELQGEIGVESELGVGSRFRVRLPLGAMEAAA